MNNRIVLIDGSIIISSWVYIFRISPLSYNNADNHASYFEENDCQQYNMIYMWLTLELIIVTVRKNIGKINSK